MITDNGAIPICREHNQKITVCSPCQLVIAERWDVMPKVQPHAWNRDTEPLGDYHYREQRANEENQARLHSWAVVYVYVDPLEGVA